MDESKNSPQPAATGASQTTDPVDPKHANDFPTDLQPFVLCGEDDVAESIPDDMDEVLRQMEMATPSTVSQAEFGGLAPVAPLDGPRGFKTLLAAASELASDSDLDRIEEIIAEGVSLYPLQKKKLHRAIKHQTDYSLEDISRAERHNSVATASYPDDDHGQALRVIDHVGQHNLIAADNNLWCYQDGIWRAMQHREIRSVIQSVLVAAGQESQKQRIDGIDDAIRNHLYQSDHSWNQGNPEAINVRNGLLEPSCDGHWALHPHRREDFRTTQLPIYYDPTATVPRFELFMTEIFDGDKDANDKQLALLELLGYTLVSHARREKFIVLVGEGGNGKSKILKVIENLCGYQNTAAVQPGELKNKFQRAGLHQKLANLVSEVPEGALFPDAELKALTSGELGTVEHKNQDPFQISPYATCWFGTNSMPGTRDFSEGLFRRAVVFEFNNRFEVGRNADPHLDEKLAEELPGILNLVLAAYADVIQRGHFTQPESCRRAIEAWRLETDQVTRFIDDVCIQQPGHIQTSTLYSRYSAWCKDAGISRVLGKNAFVDRVKRRGFEKGKKDGQRCFFGINILSTKTSRISQV